MAALEREGSNILGYTEAQLTTSKDWKAVSKDSSAASTYGAEEGQLTNISSSPDTITKREHLIMKNKHRLIITMSK